MANSTRLEALTKFDLEAPEMQAHYSSLTLHRKCPQAWYYRYGQRLERDGSQVSPERDFGIWWAALQAAESLNRGRYHDSLIFPPRKLTTVDGGPIFQQKSVTPQEVLDAAGEWWNTLSNDTKAVWGGRMDITDLKERLGDALRSWTLEYQDTFAEERPLGVEVFWKRELPKPEGDTRWAQVNLDKLPRMNLIGYIDELFYDVRRKMVTVRDAKSTKSMDASTALDDFMDSQLHLYSWGVGPALRKLGQRGVRAISYDRMRSISPKTPQVTATGSLSKSVTMYDEAMYRAWASEDGRPLDEELSALELSPEAFEKTRHALDQMMPGPLWGKVGEFYVTGAKAGLPKFGTYSIDEEVIARLRTPAERSKWFQRSRDPVNGNIVKAHLRAAIDTSMDIWQTQQRATVTGQAARNLNRQGCGFCDYQELCRAQMIGGARGEYDIEEFGLRVKEKR